MTGIAALDHDQPTDPAFVHAGRVFGRDVYTITQGPAAADSLREAPAAADPAPEGTDSTHDEPVPSALADVLAGEAERIVLLGEIVEILTPPRPSQVWSHISHFLRRQRVDHVHELDADALRQLIEQMLTLNAARGQR